jgi:hypothetical protein
MSTTETSKKAAKKPLPKPGKRQTFEKAAAETLKQYRETFEKLAK